MPTGVPCKFTPLQQDAIAVALELGWSERAIAKYVGMPRTNVQRYLARLRGQPVRPEDLEIVLPVNVLKPEPTCRPGHVEEGDPIYCTECDKTGCEKHPRLRRDRRTDPKPDPRPPDTKPKRKPTRRERRKQAVA